MSVSDLKEYGRRAAADPVVGAKAKELGVQNIAKQAAYAKTLGFNFTVEDMEALAKEISPKGELTDEQLHGVAGGVDHFQTVTSAAIVVCAAVNCGGFPTIPTTTTAGGW